MTAVPKAITVFDVMACPSAPIAHLAIIFAPCIDGPIANGNLGSAASFALEVRGLVHVAINAVVDTSYGVSGGKTVRTTVHSQSFVLKGFL